MNDSYNDIINLPHHVSKKHQQMSLYDRAAQFAPFAALTGMPLVLKGHEWVDEKRLDHDEAVLLDRRLNYLKLHLKERPEVSITYFEPLVENQGGYYMTMKGFVKNIDENFLELTMTNGKTIPIRYLLVIESTLFDGMETI